MGGIYRNTHRILRGLPVLAPTLTADGQTVLKSPRFSRHKGKEMDSGRIIGIITGIVLVGGLIAANIFLLWS
jgi:hypothetical protein